MISEIPIELSEATARLKSHFREWLSQVLRISYQCPNLMAFTCCRLLLCKYPKHQAHPRNDLLEACLALLIHFQCLFLLKRLPSSQLRLSMLSLLRDLFHGPVEERTSPPLALHHGRMAHVPSGEPFAKFCPLVFQRRG